MTLDRDIGRDALRLLAIREHSRRELQRKLLSRGHAEDLIEQLLDDLSNRGLLNEERMTEAYAAERVRKGFGPVRIRQELHRRGLVDDLIDSHLDKSKQEWLGLMAAAHDKKFGPARVFDAKECARRARFLEYRGFPADLIAAFLRGDDGS